MSQAYIRTLLLVTSTALIACGDSGGVTGSGSDSDATSGAGSASDGGSESSAGSGGSDSSMSASGTGESDTEATSAGPGGMTSGGTGGTEPTSASATTSGVSESSATEDPTGASDTEDPTGASDTEDPTGASDTEDPTGASDTEDPTGESDTDTGDPCDEEPVNLVVNGSFEEPVVVHPKHWDIYTTNEIPGWEVDWVDEKACEEDDPVDEPVIELQRNLLVTAVDGVQYAELDTDCHGPEHNANTDEKTTVRLLQDIDTVEPGVYEVRFWAVGRPNVPGAQHLTAGFAGGKLLDDVPVPNVWTEYVFQVDVLDGVSLLDFTDTGEPDSLGVFLDDVSVHLIPHECLEG